MAWHRNRRLGPWVSNLVSLCVSTILGPVAIAAFQSAMEDIGLKCHAALHFHSRSLLSLCQPGGCGRRFTGRHIACSRAVWYLKCRLGPTINHSMYLKWKVWSMMWPCWSLNCFAL